MEAVAAEAALISLALLCLLRSRQAQPDRHLVSAPAADRMAVGARFQATAGRATATRLAVAAQRGLKRASPADIGWAVAPGRRQRSAARKRSGHRRDQGLR